MKLQSKRVLFVSLIILMLSTASFADFTIGVLGDTQYLSQSDNGGKMMKRMTQFFIDRKEELNVVFVTSNGDMTNDGNVPEQWERAAAAYEILWDAGIPYAPCQGNHDSLDSLNKYFPVSEFETRPYFGGYYQGIENAFYLFEAEGMEFLLLVEQDNENSRVKSWANDMRYMFNHASAFNQDLSGWCVTLIPTEPPYFDDYANSWTLPNSRPIWGTCP